MSCTQDKEQNGPKNNTSTADQYSESKFFTRIDDSQTGIDFVNVIEENERDNILLNDGLYQGGGVASLDINNDGLMDLYFAGNQSSDRLYLNKGDFQFQDISKGSKLDLDEDWSSGVSIVDINGDGYDDIYVCKFFYDDKARLANKLYINNGDLSFTERAKEYGLADQGHSIMANFFDFDNDGDLDVYVCNQPPSTLDGKKKLKGKRDLQYTDRLYRNDAGKFIDVTKEAGITNYAYTLSATTCDLNNDGWTDIYIACDYEEPDQLFINNGKGGFKNTINTAMKHIGNFSMGADIADINNDGHLDVYTVDMVAEDNYRQKTNMSGMNPEKFWNLVKAGFHHQYMFNALQLNNGNGSFSEIAQMAGISNTDWSWAPLFVDVDNDGLKDLLVSNGLYKDIRNKDFEKERDKILKKKKNKVTPQDLLDITSKSPSVKIQNYAFRNNGDLGFDKKSDQWGLTDKGWSQGMIYVDLDNDNDLDLVMNNTNQKAWIYKNNSSENKVNNYLNISLKGSKGNSKAIGSRIELKTAALTQTIDHTPYRGYMSTCQAISHFGLGAYDRADVKITFPNGKVWEKKSVKANQRLEVNLTEAKEINVNTPLAKTLFTQKQVNSIRHFENPFDDYEKEILIPYKLSSLGPVLAVADVNQDGLDDFYLGGSINVPGKMCINNGNGFDETVFPSFDLHKVYEDGAAQFVDIDGDGDEDLYVASGGNEFGENKEGFNDRFYFNDGNGDFNQGIPMSQVSISGGAVCFIDFDGDGDKDIFVGGRQVPGQYGRSTDSNLLELENGQFTNVTESKAKIFKELGMVTSAKATDLDKDGKEELVVVGEWMPISVFIYNGQEMQSKQEATFAKTNGMWNSVEVADLDQDGNLDLIIGNLGLNNKYTATKAEPFKLFVNDFDQNGTNDVYLGFNQDGKTFPVRGRQCSSEQMPFVAEKFETYDVFGKSTVEDVLEGREEGMTVKEAYTFAHTIFYGDGGGNFEALELPMESQIAPVYGIVVYDFDGDGDQDLFTAGNFHDREVETTRSDAGIGCVLINESNRKWRAMHPTESGILANGDVRAAKLIKQNNSKPVLAIANNNAPMLFYTLN